MKLQRVRVVTIAKAPRATVWSLLADGATWSRWGPFDSVELVRPGRDHEWGLGSVRRIASGRTVTEERIDTYAADHCIRYSLVSGIPLRDYHGEVVVRDVLEGTEIEWSSTFRPPYWVVGPLARWRIQRFLRDLSNGLAGAAERRVLELSAA